MRKTLFTLLFACVAFVACQKEKETDLKPTRLEETVKITITASQDDATKTVLNGTNAKWAAGDKVTVIYKKDGESTWSTAESESASTSDAYATATFEATLTSPDAGENAFAIYPANNLDQDDADNAKITIAATQHPTASGFDGGSDIMISKPFSASSSPISTQFARANAVLKIKINNATLSSEKLISLSVTGENDLSGDVLVGLADKTVNGIENGSHTVTAEYATANQFTVGSSNYVYLIVKPQTLTNASHLIVNGETDSYFFSKDITLSQDIYLNAGHIVPLRIAVDNSALIAKNTVLWSEDWSDINEFTNSSAAVPSTASNSNTGTVVYNGGTVSYTATDCNVYDGNLAGSTAPEILVRSNKQLTVSDIPVGCVTRMTLSLLSNRALEDLEVTSTVTDDIVKDDTDKEWYITIPANTASIDLSIKNKNSGSNGRIDDIVLVAGTPAPRAVPATANASNTASVSGTTATLNGSYSLKNGAIDSEVTAVGFRYKKDDGDYTTVAATKSASFSANIEGLTKNGNYSYQAFVVYNGNTVYGASKAFKPTSTQDTNPGSLTINYSSFSTHGTSYSDVSWSSTATTSDVITGSAYVCFDNGKTTYVKIKNNHPALRNEDELPGSIQSITATRTSDGSNRTLNIYGGLEPLDNSNYTSKGVSLGTITVTTSGATKNLTDAQKEAAYKYFYIYGSSNVLYLSSLVINYQ